MELETGVIEMREWMDSKNSDLAYYCDCGFADNGREILGDGRHYAGWLSVVAGGGGQDETWRNQIASSKRDTGATLSRTATHP